MEQETGKKPHWLLRHALSLLSYWEKLVMVGTRM
jgi:hypothetical protein